MFKFSVHLHRLYLLKFLEFNIITSYFSFDRSKSGIWIMIGKVDGKFNISVMWLLSWRMQTLKAAEKKYT